MQELRLLGVHRDEEHLLLVAANGTKYRLVIDSALRAALRRVPARVENQQPRSQPSMSPREIQAHIRSGATAEDVAKLADLPLAHVQRYEGPVLAERQHVCALAGKHQIRSTHGGGHSTYLADVVADRLAAREADDHVEWDAWRLDTGSWLVQLSFRTAQTDRRAQWSYHPQRAHLEPLDDEARWFSHLEDAPPPAAYDPSRQVRPGAEVTAITSVHRESPPSGAKPEPSFATTDALMEHLQGHRAGASSAVSSREGVRSGGRFGPARAAALSARSSIEHQHGADPRPGSVSGLRAVAASASSAQPQGHAGQDCVASDQKGQGPQAVPGNSEEVQSEDDRMIDVTDTAQARRQAQADRVGSVEATDVGAAESSATVVPLAAAVGVSPSAGGVAAEVAGEVDVTGKDHDVTSGDDANGHLDQGDCGIGDEPERKADCDRVAAEDPPVEAVAPRGADSAGGGSSSGKQRSSGRPPSRSDSAKNKRSKVPSWDEIMFGSRKD